MPLYQTGPNSWSNRPPEGRTARSALPMPMVISDTMEPTEQVDGRFYTSKRAFRATGRALGLIEVGNERLPKKTRASASVEQTEKRRQSIKIAVEKVKSGIRT